jgi:hypothetical protein
MLLQIGLGSVNAKLRLLAADGRGLSALDRSLPGDFYDFIWEQNLTALEPLTGNSGEARYFLVLSNPKSFPAPYYLAVQTVQDFHIDNAEKSYGELGPEEIRYLPLRVFRTPQGLLNFEFEEFIPRQVRGEIGRSP